MSVTLIQELGNDKKTLDYGLDSPEKKKKNDADDSLDNVLELLETLKVSSSHKLRLRTYQVLIVDAIFSLFRKGQSSVLLYLPTGGGKTAIAANVIKKLNVKKYTKIAIFTHRDELAFQMEKSLLLWGLKAEEISYIKSTKKVNLESGMKMRSLV